MIVIKTKVATIEKAKAKTNLTRLDWFGISKYPIKIPNIAASVVPAVEGEINLFRPKACIIIPAIEMLVAVRMITNVRGKRDSRKIRQASLSKLKRLTTLTRWSTPTNSEVMTRTKKIIVMMRRRLFTIYFLESLFVCFLLHTNDIGWLTLLSFCLVKR